MPQIGPYTLYTIETGRFGLDGGAMFGIIPKPLWEKRIPADGRNRIPLNTRCLLLEGDGRLILIDNGVGEDTFDPKYRDIYGIDFEYANLHDSLRAHGFGADEITDVVLTHLHFDHCGGSTYTDGDTINPTFPNATYHVQGDHWNWATDANPKEQGSFVGKTFEPLEASGQLQRVEGEGELWPGIEVITVNGHTESQQMVKISDAQTTLVFVGDLLPTSHHLAPAWTMAYDVRPLTTIREKAEFLEHAVEAEWNLFFEHDPEVAVASLERTDRGIQVRDARSLADL